MGTPTKRLWSRLYAPAFHPFGGGRLRSDRDCLCFLSHPKNSHCKKSTGLVRVPIAPRLLANLDGTAESGQNPLEILDHGLNPLGF